MKGKKRRATVTLKRTNIKEDRSKLVIYNNGNGFSDILTNKTPKFFAFVMQMAFECTTSNYAVFTVDTKLHDLHLKYDIGINLIGPFIQDAIDLDILKINPFNQCYTFNPFLVAKGRPTNDVLLLFMESKYYNTDIVEWLRTEKWNQNYTTVNKNDNIYILEHNVDECTAYYKIGFSENIIGRLDTYYSHNPTIKLIFSTHIENAKSFEQSIHSNFKSLYKNEWYDLKTLRDICAFVNIDLSI